MKIILISTLGAILFSLALSTSAVARADGKEIGYLETFALALDRDKALEDLIPGSRDYYYYHALHYQNNGQLERVDELLRIWRERHEDDDRRRVIENRQILLSYDNDPERALQQLRDRLQLWYPHQRERAGASDVLPTVLDQAQISRDQFAHFARTQQRHHVGNFERTAYDWLIRRDLSPDERRDLLSRLDHPDYPDLPAVIAADLNYERSRGFGQYPVHARLTIEQLNELQRLRPELIHNPVFIHAYLSGLRPGPDTDVERDLDERRDYLERLWQFASGLAPTNNSIKLNILYHRLVLDRKQGVHDLARFREYIGIPRHASYINIRRVDSQRATNDDQWANPAIDFRAAMILPPVGNDESLVRAYLTHFFQTQDGHPGLRDLHLYLNVDYLTTVYAEAHLMAGTGDAEMLYSRLTPAEVQALRERIDIDFAPTNPSAFKPGDRVVLDVDIKHVQQLLIRIYRINELNYYREEGRQVDTTITLDGLVPNYELIHTYDEPPIRRVRRSFNLDQIDAPGVWVVEMIGNGRSSRAVLRMGRLHYTMETGPAGHIFRIYGKDNEPRSGAEVLIDGRRYAPDNRGRIVVPYTTRPGRQKLIMIDGDHATLDHFDHERETYRLDAGFHLEREFINDQLEAELIIRPTLRLNDGIQPVALLRNVRLTITTRDFDGISSSRTLDDFALNERGETVHRFRIPERTRHLAFKLDATVESISGSENVELHAMETLHVNESATTGRLVLPYLTRDGENHILEVRGRNGEPLPNERVSLQLWHRDVVNRLAIAMQSDRLGRIHLGPLDEIARLSVRMADGYEQDWTLRSPAYSYLPSLTGVAGASLLVPWTLASEEPLREEVGLLELREGRPVADRFASLDIREGYLVLRDLEPGDYTLLLKRDDQRLSVHVSKGSIREGFILGELRYLDQTDARPMALLEPVVDGKKVRIQTRHAGPDTRVHVFASRYLNAFNAYESFSVSGRYSAAITRLPVTDSVYVAGRDIGDEYRYILDRRSARRFPGNMLARPGLLLNPWALRETETGELRATEGEDYNRIMEERQRSVAGLTGTADRETSRSDPHDFNFLGRSPVVMANLRPDEKGVIELDRDDLGDRHILWIVALDGKNTASRSIALEEIRPGLRDRRIPEALSPDRHFVQRRNVEILEAGDSLTFPDLTEARMETYDSIASVYNLFMTLNGQSNGDDKLSKFAFILNWSNLEREEKLGKFAGHASHELNFFLYHKDNEFFSDVVRPYLINKKDKTFMDHYLIQADLSAYLEPWTFSRLNALERILLGGRLDKQNQIVRHISDLFNLLPPDVERDNRLFDLALQGSALTTESVSRKLFEPVSMPMLQRRSRGLEADALAESRAFGGGPVSAGMPYAPPMAEESALMQGEMAFSIDADDAIEQRDRIRPFYRDVPSTIEWVENNYYELPTAEQNSSLIKVNAFWRDYAQRDTNKPFLSPHFPEAGGNFSEMMLALAVLDLPYHPGRHEVEGFVAEAEEERPVSLTAASPLIAFFRRVEPVEPAEMEREGPILVSQNFFRHDDRYRMVGNEVVDKFITDEFLIQTLYGAQIVVTNPTSSRRRLDVLMQVPEGAVPLLGDQAMRSRHVSLDPFATVKVEHHFYFPEPGSYAHFPVHVAQGEHLAAHAAAMRFNVVAEPTEIDRESWEFISQHGTGQQVLDFLNSQNVEDTDVERIAWRMRDPDFFVEVLALLRDRLAYDDTLWSYSLIHDYLPAIREYLRHQSSFVEQCGIYLQSTLLSFNPVERRRWELLEYDPLVNARAHQLGQQRSIANEAVHHQYMATLGRLAHQNEIDDDDRMMLTYYLLLQDRIPEAIEFFGQINPDKLDTRLQYDYFNAYVAFFTEDLDLARQIAESRVDHPIERWRNRFENVLAYLDEIEGTGEARPADIEDRDQRQQRLAESDPALAIHVEGAQIEVAHSNLASVTVNYYLMDIELLFSNQPFVAEHGGHFAYIWPNVSETIELPATNELKTLMIPDELARRNVLIEVVGGPLKRTATYFSNSLDVQMMENYGQLQVSRRGGDRGAGGVYIKVYARMSNGEVRFYKDGYTDLRGRFDYASVSGEQQATAMEFAILILSDEHGAIVREALAPGR